MAPLKENFQMQVNALTLAGQERLLGFKNWFNFAPFWKKFLFVLLAVAILPGSLLIRFGAEFYFSRQYNQNTLSAHQSFQSPDKLTQSKVFIIQNQSGTQTAYAQIGNPNLDLSLQNFSYAFSFLDGSGKEVYNSKGESFILANQKKWLVVPRIEVTDQIESGKLIIGELNWQKRLSAPDLELKMGEPFVYEQVNPLATVTEGTVVNNSPYTLSRVNLVLVLYGQQSQILAVTTRDEFKLLPYERRAYKISWPGLYRDDVSRVGLEAYTNALDPSNISVQTTNQTKPEDPSS